MIDASSIRTAEKSLSSSPKWTDGDDGRLWLTAPLDVNGITIANLTLRARAFRNRPDEDVLFQLEYEHDAKRRDRAIDRIDWRPLHIHNNKEHGPSAYQFIEQKCSHQHCFESNWIAAENRLRAGNLPIATPIDEEIQSFDALLAFVGKTFRINNVSLIETPPWEPSLL